MALPAPGKALVSAACQTFIEEVLKPRFLPAIRPTRFNYPINIHGKWRGRSYSFITRYRSGFPENLGEEFDSAFTRLDWIAASTYSGIVTQAPGSASTSASP